MADDYATAWDTLTTAIGAAKGQSAGYISDVEHLTFEQQIQVAQTVALLSIAQEISSLNPNNTISFGEDGKKRNGWGHVIG